MNKCKKVLAVLLSVVTLVSAMAGSVVAIEPTITVNTSTLNKVAIGILLADDVLTQTYHNWLDIAKLPSITAGNIVKSVSESKNQAIINTYNFTNKSNVLLKFPSINSYIKNWAIVSYDYQLDHRLQKTTFTEKDKADSGKIYEEQTKGNGYLLLPILTDQSKKMLIEFITSSSVLTKLKNAVMEAFVSVKKAYF